MKLARFGPKGQERPALIDHQGVLRDLSGVVADIDGSALSALDTLRSIDPASLPLAPADARLGPCVAGVGKFICIGLNYADHAAETGAEIPSEPVVFMKATSAICGPNDNIIIPPGSQKTDWEVELGVVVGKRLLNASEDEAAAAIAGYCVVHDVSERAFQLERGGQWTKGKSYDSFGPIGPWLVTPDEIADVDQLGMWLEVDGRRYQDGSTHTMIFKPALSWPTSANSCRSSQGT
jgi:5-carboxymethyl-2-hydroxymuconate isomerase